MAKTVEQRSKDLDALHGVPVAVTSYWDSVVSKFQKEINTPTFKKNGDIGALAKQYDLAQNKFKQQRESKLAGTRSIGDDLQQKIEKPSNQVTDLKKELDELGKDSMASVKVKDSKDIKDRINNWEELLKMYRDVAANHQAIFNTWMKADATKTKSFLDLRAKLKQKIDAANAGLVSVNAELNSLEGKIRGTVAKYYETALNMNRKDIADATRRFLTAFGK